MARHLTIFTTLLITSIIGTTWYAAAQTEADALRFSMLSPQGTARSMGFGGALGSIGGDFSSLSVNPAGIGVYRSSEFTVTPSLKLNSTNSTYISAAGVPSTAMQDNNTRFNFNNIGVVFTNAAKGKRYKNSDWKSTSFGIGITRVADFSSNHVYSGYNDSSSASEVFSIDAINYPSDSLNNATLAGLGYMSYLIDGDGNGGFYTLPNWTTGLNQQRSVEQKGGISDINFSFGGNYKEKLLLGATISIPTLRYLSTINVREEDASGNPDNGFDYFEYQESLKTTGTGINLKLGFLYNITPYLRAGASVHTPTYFGLTDIQNRYVVSNTEGFKASLGDNTGPNTRVDAPENEYQYSLITPWRGVISAAGIIGKYGFITVDYEYVGYNSARFSFEDVDAIYEKEINNSIKNMYKGASNLRIGGEARIDILMLRVGFGYYGNPYRNATMGSERMAYSAGIGFRFDNIALDLGFTHTATEAQEQPYALNYPDGYIQAPYLNPTAPSATIKQSFNNVALTFGVRF